MNNTHWQVITSILMTVILMLSTLLYRSCESRDALHKELGTTRAEANRLIAEANKMEPDVIVQFREGIIDNGLVARLVNVTARSVSITADIKRPGSDKHRRGEMTFNPNSSKEIGESEGWAFIKGDIVIIEQDGHKSVSYTVK